MANALTLSRMVLSPVFILFFILGMQHKAAGGNMLLMYIGQIGALLIAISFEATDVLDGYVARKWNQISDFGKVFDPLADSISRFTVFLCFLNFGYASIWAVALIFYRDAIIASLRGVAAKRGIAMAACASGKIKAIVQGTAIITICSLELIETIFSRGIDVSDNAQKLMWVVAMTTLWSLYDYLWAGRDLVRAVVKGK